MVRVDYDPGFEDWEQLNESGELFEKSRFKRNASIKTILHLLFRLLLLISAAVARTHLEITRQAL